MTSPSGEDDDALWRRPDPADPAAQQPRPPARPQPPRYTGPPPTTPPPRGWQPPVVVQPPAPRQLPPQDQDALDQQERSARTLTYGVGMIAGAIVLVMVCVLCSRLFF